MQYLIEFNPEEGYIQDVVTLPVAQLLTIAEFSAWKDEHLSITVADALFDWAVEIKSALRLRLDALRRTRILAQLQETPTVFCETGEAFILRESNEVWMSGGIKPEHAIAAVIEKINVLEVEHLTPILSPVERRQLRLAISYPGVIDLDHETDHRYRWSDVLDVLFS